MVLISADEKLEEHGEEEKDSLEEDSEETTFCFSFAAFFFFLLFSCNSGRIHFFRSIFFQGIIISLQVTDSYRFLGRCNVGTTDIFNCSPCKISSKESLDIMATSIDKSALVSFIIVVLNL